MPRTQRSRQPRCPEFTMVIATIDSKLVPDLRNGMAEHLQSMYRNLEARVAEKTSELQEKRERLEALYAVTTLVAKATTLKELANGFTRQVGRVARADGGNRGSVARGRIARGRINGREIDRGTGRKRRPPVGEPAHVVRIGRLEPADAERATVAWQVRARLAQTDDVHPLARECVETHLAAGGTAVVATHQSLDFGSARVTRLGLGN